MNRMAPLAIVLAAAFALFYLSTTTPPVKPANAPATTFSAARAMIDDAALAPVPHPVGSPANARVRDQLMGRLKRLGLSPHLLAAKSREAREIGGDTWIAGADVGDVIGVLPGRNRTLPALLLMAHYDSVAGSPGAADDIAGVSSVLEIVRAVEARGQPERDVVVALTDGEEAGLLGGRAFFALDPLARRVGFVINLEARGGGGRAAMFETGPANGGVIDLYRRTAVLPDSNSLAVFVYKLLPNDTDFSLAKARGLPGLNYAFIGRQFDYHSPSSTVAALDRGAVQHMGEQVLGTAAAVAFSRVLPARTPDQVYSDLFGAGVVAYPAWAGWMVVALAGALLGVGAASAGARGRLGARGVLGGVVMAGVILVASGLAIASVRLATGTGFGFLAARPLLARFALFEAASGLAAIGAIVLGAALFAGRERRLVGLWMGLLLTGLLGAAILQAMVPLIAFLAAWPLLAACLAAAVTSLERPRAPLAWAIAGGAAILATAWLMGVGHAFLQGLDVAGGSAPVALIAAFALLPLMWPGAGRAGGLGLAALLLAAGLTLAMWLRVTSPWSARHPQAAEPLYVVDSAAGRAWRADAAAPPGAESAWSRSVLAAEGGRFQPLLLPGAPSPVAAAAAPPIVAPGPRIEVTHAIGGAVVMAVRPAAGTARLRLDVRCDTIVADARIDGAPSPVLAHPGRWTHLRWEAAPEGLVITFTPAGPGVVDLQWAQYAPGWPPAATPMPPMPRAVMGWDLAGSTVTVGRSRVRI